MEKSFHSRYFNAHKNLCNANLMILTWHIVIYLFCSGVTNLLKHFQSRRNSRSIYPTPAPARYGKALEIDSSGNLSVPTHKIFWNHFPQSFTMFAAAQYITYSRGYLISFYDSQERLQIGIKVSKTSVALEYAQTGRRNQFIAFNVEIVDKKWHRFAFSVGNGSVSFYMDCEMIGTQKITQAIPNDVDTKGNVYLNAKAEQPPGGESIEVRR